MTGTRNGTRQLGERRVIRLLVAQQVALQLDADIAAAEQPDQAIEHAADAVAARVEQRPAGKRHQARRAAVELVEHRARLRPLAARIFMRVTSRHRLR